MDRLDRIALLDTTAPPDRVAFPKQSAYGEHRFGFSIELFFPIGSPLAYAYVPASPSPHLAEFCPEDF